MSNPSRPTTARDLFSDTPVAFKAGVVIAVVAFFLRIGSGSVTRRNGVVTSCTSTDFVKIVAAGLLVLLAFQGVQAVRRSRRKIPTWLVATFVVLFLVAAGFLAVIGFGVAFSPCQSL